MKARGFPLGAFCLLSILPLGACAFGWEDGQDAEEDAAQDGTDPAPDPFQDLTPDPDVPTECPSGLTLCSGECVDTSSNHSHCGLCDHTCEPVEVCSAGLCGLECPAEQIACSGSCVDVLSNVSNCGDCGRACTAGSNADAVCSGGVCGIVCHEGWSDMNGDGWDCETNCVPVPGGEVCNGEDDDCDGPADEDFDCVMGDTVGCVTACGSMGSGICTSSCRAPTSSSCQPPSEICNGDDDDCDGSCDETFECCRGEAGSCATSCGSIGTRTCSASCAWSSCSPPSESCNNSDDDCDTIVDDGCTPEAPTGVTITQNYGGNNYAVRLCWTDNSTYEGGYELRKEDWNDGSQLVSVSSLAANTTCRTETLTGNPHHLCVRSIGWDGSSQGWKNITLPTTVDVFWVTIPCNSSLCPNAGDTSEALHFH